jgi:hypothetical protein
VVNPDGLLAFMEASRRAGRKNGYGVEDSQPRPTYRGVDLNRNYPFRWGALGERGSKGRRTANTYRGPAPASEPETRAIIALARREHFLLSLSFHTGAVAILAPYTIDGVRNPKPNEAWIVAKTVARSLAPHPQRARFRVRRKLYSVDGTDQDFLRHQFGTAAYIIEGARRSPVKQAEREAVVAAVRKLWIAFAARISAGPTLSVNLVQRGGPPRPVEVRIKEVALREGERWSSRERDGRVHRLLPQPGSYRVQAFSAGKLWAETVVNIGSVWKQIELMLPDPKQE